MLPVLWADGVRLVASKLMVIVVCRRLYRRVSNQRLVPRELKLLWAAPPILANR